MISSAFAFGLACLLSFLLTPLIGRRAQALGLVEGANVRLKAHARPVPRLGGIGIAIAFFAPFVALFLLDTELAQDVRDDATRFAAFALGGLAIFALGLWDDLRGAGARTKFLVETAVAVGLWSTGFRIVSVTLPFVGQVDLGILGLLVTILWIVGIANAINLIDGLDGLAAGVVFFASAAHALIAAIDANFVLMLLTAACAGSVLGFLPHNFHPARIFLGDSGALFLGYVLAVSSIYGATQKTTTLVALLAPVLVLGVPILDTLLAVRRRALAGRPIFDGDREHLHHRLLDLGLSHRRTVSMVYALCAAFALAGLTVVAFNDHAKAIVLFALVLILAVFERRLGFFRQAKALRHPDIDPARCLREVRDAAREGGSSAAWEALVARAEELDIYRMRAEGTTPAREWSRPGFAGHPREGRTRLRVSCPDGTAFTIDKRPLRRGSPELDELFRALLEEYLAGGSMSRPSELDGRAAGGA